MNKHIFITNGVGGCGKDTFADLMNQFIPIKKYSAISKVLPYRHRVSQRVRPRGYRVLRAKG